MICPAGSRTGKRRRRIERMLKCFYVYVIFRPWDGSPCYVGKGKGDRWRQFGARSNRHLLRIIAKAERLGLDLPIIKVRENLTEADAFQTERALIGAIGRGKRGPLVNLTDGGEGWAGGKHTQKTKDTIRQHHVDYFNDPAMRAKTSAATKAGMAKPAVQAKLCKSQSERWAEVEASEQQSKRLTGRSLSQEHCDAIGASHLGKKRSAEARANMTLAQLRRPPHSPETITKMRASANARWENQVERDRVSAWMKDHLSDPKIRERMSADAKLRFEDDPELKERMSEYGKKGAAARWNPTESEGI